MMELESSKQELVFKMNFDHNIYLKRELKKLSELGLFTDIFIRNREGFTCKIHYLILSAFGDQLNENLNPTDNPLLYMIHKEENIQALVEMLYIGITKVESNCIIEFRKLINEMKSCNIKLKCNEVRKGKKIYVSIIDHNDLLVNHLWESRSTTRDLIFVSQNLERIYAHSLILSACSKRFRNLYSSPEKFQSLIVAMPKFSKEELEGLLEVCYKGTYNFPEESLAKVSRLAKKFGIERFLNSTTSTKGRSKESKALDTDSASMNIQVLPDRISDAAMGLIESSDSGNCYIWTLESSVKVHNVIAKTCPFLKNLFDSFDHTKEDVLIINSFTQTELEAVLDFMYKGEANFIVDDSGINPELVEWLGLQVNDEPDPEDSKFCHQTEEQNLSGENYQSFQEIKLLSEENGLRTNCTEIESAETKHHEVKFDKDIKAKRTVQFCCKQCHTKFENYRQFKTHFNSHNLPPIFKCEICGKIFLKKCNLTRHENLHAPLTHQCVTCGKMYATKEHLIEHARSHTGEKPFECNICLKRFSARSGLNHHLKLHDKSKTVLFVCDVCGKEFSRQGLWGHMKTHNKEFACDACDRLFATPSALKRHFKWVHEKHPSLKCEFCSNEYELKSHLDRHMVNEHRYLNGEFINRKAYACSRCSQSFHTPFRLEKHMKSKHNAKELIPCSVCGKLLSGNSAVKYHMRTHTGERPHNCLYCPKKFTRPDLLKKHTRIHTGERFICHICEKSFTSKHYLTEHSWTHNENGRDGSFKYQLLDYELDNNLAKITLHQCSLCTMTFLTEDSLREHHTTKACLIVSSVICQYCGLELDSNEKLNSHLEICSLVWISDLEKDKHDTFY